MLHIPNKSHTSRGLILADILVALALSALFVTLITQSLFISRSVFDSARERDRLIGLYEAHAAEFEGLSPNDTRTILVPADTSLGGAPTTTIHAIARRYGNERTETDITISSELIHDPIRFASIRLNVGGSYADTAGTPLCSVDFSRRDTVGAFPFFTPLPASLPAEPKVTPIMLTINPTYKLTDLHVRNGFAYISNDSFGSHDPDIFIFDIRDPSNPELYIDVDSGPGFAALALAGNRLYMAMTSRTAQLQIIRLRDLGGMNVEANYKLPLPFATATPPLASSIFYNKGKIYLGTEKWDGEEFNIIDVSDPTNPKRVGSFETGSKINSIFVFDDIAYVAASDERQLRAIDVHDPTHPVLIYSQNPSGWQRQEGKAISYFEDMLQLGRTSGGFNVKQDHELFLWGTTTALSMSADIPGGVYGIVTDRSYIYAATRQLDKEIQIFKREASATTTMSVSLPVAPQAMTCERDDLYVLAASSPVIYKISFK